MAVEFFNALHQSILSSSNLFTEVHLKPQRGETTADKFDISLR
jgi:hypothetical protein